MVGAYFFAITIIASLTFIMMLLDVPVNGIETSYSLAEPPDEHSNRSIRGTRSPIYQYKGTESFLINTTACHIPNYGQNLTFIEAVNKKISCGKRAIFVTKIYDKKNKKTRLMFKIDKRKMLTYAKKNENFTCCYSFVSLKAGLEDRQISYSKCKKFISGSKADFNKEVVTVDCRKTDKSGTISYNDAYVFVKKQPKHTKKNKKSWNVLLVGIDTMSRARFINAMPELAKQLRKKGWLDFRGYQKVASNTLPNFVSLLTGKSLATIKKLHNGTIKGYSLDDYNNLMAWSAFRKAGYITAYGEDTTLPGLPYTFFVNPPTHHFMRPYFHTAKSQPGNKFCVKHKPAGISILEYAYDFANTYRAGKFFGAFWISSFSHDIDYYPSLYENDTINFFNKLSKIGVQSNTFVLLLSDHGIRFGPSRFELNSFYAERLPMLYIWVPIRFRKQHKDYYHSLQVNQNRLVTPYDIYMTLAKIPLMYKGSEQITAEDCPKCKGLFQEIPTSRTCADAGVSEVWCSCHGMEHVHRTNNVDAENSLQLAVTYVQKQSLHVETAFCWACHTLRLNNVFHFNSYVNQKLETNYLIAFEMVTEPGNDAKTITNGTISYEAIVRKDKNKLLVLERIDTISPFSSRINCVTKGDLSYCICKPVNCTILNNNYSIRLIQAFIGNHSI